MGRPLCSASKVFSHSDFNLPDGRSAPCQTQQYIIGWVLGVAYLRPVKLIGYHWLYPRCGTNHSHISLITPFPTFYREGGGAKQRNLASIFSVLVAFEALNVKHASGVQMIALNIDTNTLPTSPKFYRGSTYIYVQRHLHHSSIASSMTLCLKRCQTSIKREI